MAGWKRYAGQYRQLLLTCLLVIIGFSVVTGIHVVYGDTLEEVFIGNQWLAFKPVYNRDGSWLHGRLNVGYRPGLLLAEGILTLFAGVFCIRFMGFFNYVIQLSSVWSCWLYVMLSTTIARIIQVLAGQYTLDYIYIGVMHGTFDLFDFYLGIGLAGLMVWVVLAEIKYRRLRKACTEGMRFWQRLKWEFSFMGRTFQAAFLPRARWDSLKGEI